MPKFILSYRTAKSFDAAADPAGLAAWQAFLTDVIKPNVVDPGWPVFEPSVLLGETGAATQLGGYSIVTASDVDAVVSMAKRCPTLERHGGVEVAVLAELPGDHPAEQMRSSM
jgi:hypothetical protein